MTPTQPQKEQTVGKLIVVEGTDSVGKSTQIKALEARLKADGARITKHHFPTYYSYQGTPVEKYLAGDFGEPETLSPYFVNSLYAEDRAITWRLKLKSAYEKGRTLLLDRYTTSSLIYQSSTIDSLAEKKRFLDFVEDFEYNKLGIARPDIVIFLHAPLETIARMMAARTNNPGIANDVYERNLPLLQKVHDNAMFVAEYLGWTMINCATPAGAKMRSIEDIHTDVYKAVSKILK